MSNTTITTGKIRISYPHLFEPVAAPGSDKKKYSLSVVIPKSDKATIQKIQRAIEAAKEEGKAKWGGRIPAKLKTPLRDGDEDRPDDPVYADSYFFNANSDRRPGVVDRALNEILDPDEIYPGCYGRVNVSFYAYDFNGTRGIAAGLQHVQKVADGERIGGGISVEAAFADDYEDDDDMDLD